MDLSIVKNAVSVAQKTFAMHSPAMLTAIGAAGVLTTSILTFKATVASMRTIQALEETRKKERTLQALEEIGNGNNEYCDPEELTISEKVAVCWQNYIPAALSGVGTIAAVVGSHTIHTSRRAALLSAYSVTEKAYQEYQAKVKNHLGSSNEKRLRDSLNEDRIRNNPVPEDELMHLQNGKGVLGYESLTGRYFMTDMATLRNAEATINRMLGGGVYASVNDFFKEVGLPTTQFGEEIGWNAFEEFTLYITTILSDDNRPCLSVDYNRKPLSTYRNFH